MQGIFTISLDFELFWGVRDHRTLTDYGNNISYVHTVIPRLLKLFDQYGIHCTWATVGFIFCRNQTELLENLPQATPKYENRKFDQYDYIRGNDLEQRFHFAPELIKLITQAEGQEVATHTFSHYYTLERGADLQSFDADLKSAKSLAAKYGCALDSIVFPRNQYDENFLEVCKNNGITIYRGTETSRLYQTRSRTDETMVRRGLRLADAYINISGHHTFDPKLCKETNGMWNVPSSRFLRPYTGTASVLDPLRLIRIKKAMKHAAVNHRGFHLWWHPHNFGANMEENFVFLEKICDHYKRLQEKYTMTSLTMAEIKKHYG